MDFLYSQWRPVESKKGTYTDVWCRYIPASGDILDGLLKWFAVASSVDAIRKLQRTGTAAKAQYYIEVQCTHTDIDLPSTFCQVWAGPISEHLAHSSFVASVGWGWATFLCWLAHHKYTMRRILHSYPPYIGRIQYNMHRQQFVHSSYTVQSHFKNRRKYC